MGEDTKKAIEAQKRALLESIPEDHAEQIRAAAANVSGKPKEEISLEDALAILQEINNPEVEEEGEAVAENFVGNMTPDEIKAAGLFIERLNGAILDGRLAEMTRHIIETASEPRSPIQTMDDAKRYFDDWGKKLHRMFFTELATDEDETNQAISSFIHKVVDGILEEAVKRIEASISASGEGVGNLLQQVASIIPQNHVIPNNKLANSLTEDIIDAGEVDLIVSGRGTKNEILTRCILSYEGDDITLISRKPFTEYDREVANAVASLYEYGDEAHIITPAMVYRTMVHATETETPSPQQVNAVTQSLDKMRFVRVVVDCSNELKQRKLSLNGGQIDEGIIDTYLLALKRMYVSAGGQRVIAYKIIEKPIVYEYSQLINQVITVESKVLDIRDKDGAKIPNTERRIEIKGYLIRRIERMKGRSGRKQSKHILYDDLYKSICKEEPTDKEKRSMREYVDICLKSWKQDKYISRSDDIKQGRKKIGVEITI